MTIRLVPTSAWGFSDPGELSQMGNFVHLGCLLPEGCFYPRGSCLVEWGLGRRGLHAPPSTSMLGFFLNIKADCSPLFRWSSLQFFAHVGTGKSTPTPSGLGISNWWILYGSLLFLFFISPCCSSSQYYSFFRHQGYFPYGNSLFPVTQVISLLRLSGTSSLHM